MDRKSVTEACGWEQAPRYLIRDRDGAYSEVFIRRLRSIGIRDRPTSPRSSWQNGYAERLIGSIRRNSLTTLLYLASATSVTCCSVILHEILQSGPHASIPGERYAGLTRRRSHRAHSLSPNLGRTASPIWPDLIYDRRNGRRPRGLRQGKDAAGQPHPTKTTPTSLPFCWMPTATPMAAGKRRAIRRCNRQ
jgi:hypothetical protein